jgi:hypothetical protein
MSRDGSILVVRTYSDAYVWSGHGGDVAAALAGRPATIALPGQPQGEGVAVDGARLLLDSEGPGSDVLSVPLPLPPAAGSSVPAHGSATPRPSGAARSHPRAADRVRAAVASAAVLALLATATAVAWRRRRKRPARG